LLLPPSTTHLRSLLSPPPPSEALNHFKAFNKVNTNAMFNEIDLNNDSEITIDEWKGFWENLLQTGIYKPEEIESELETLLRGEAWVDWNDNRHT